MALHLKRKYERFVLIKSFSPRSEGEIFDAKLFPFVNLIFVLEALMISSPLQSILA